eukprot:8410427-Alexandrium_andersonii.AAC.1
MALPTNAPGGLGRLNEGRLRLSVCILRQATPPALFGAETLVPLPSLGGGNTTLNESADSLPSHDLQGTPRSPSGTRSLRQTLLNLADSVRSASARTLSTHTMAPRSGSGGH